MKYHTSFAAEQQPVESDGEIEDDDSIHIYSKETNPILFENDEGTISDDEQVSISHHNLLITYSFTHSSRDIRVSQAVDI